ncbi:M1 family metallopeptidase [Motilibacter deserti]|uniref:Aminopeptidase N n=1 Tax=Motilibacter deserti TaxID=2714956 RepID=A0ABX0GP71_9ACTN|nr:M1 family metallopeptidase [Motilibacter deserti]NHC12641.1 M1 family metallopeptidase [Motilibacter deserti]
MKRRYYSTLAVAGAAVMFGTTPALTSEYSPGSTTGPDAYFEQAGNGGYDAQHYDLKLKYDTATKLLTATADITVKTTQALESLSLDLRDLSVSAVRVNGMPAKFVKTPPITTHGYREGGELIVTLPSPVRRHKTIELSIDYGGTMGQPRDNTNTRYGFVAFADGAFVANEAEGAATWYPVNDVIADKATYDFEITVPEGKTAVANGLLESQSTANGWTTFTWVAKDPMTAYLTTASIGDYDLTTQTGPDGLPIINAVDRKLTAAARNTTNASLARQPEIIEFLSSKFGPYPLEAAGAIVDNDSVGYALETQTRPIYSGSAGLGTVVHELAHQWYGNSVSPTNWSDIWLNEGFAVYATWMWTEHTGGRSTQASFDAAYAAGPTSARWAVPVAAPGATEIFGDAVYQKGAMTLQALRVKIGEKDFWQLMRRWHQQNRYEDATTASFIAMAEKLSKQNLDNFFDVWLYTAGKPAAGSW